MSAGFEVGLPKRPLGGGVAEGVGAAPKRDWAAEPLGAGAAGVGAAVLDGGGWPNRPPGVGAAGVAAGGPPPKRLLAGGLDVGAENIGGAADGGAAGVAEAAGALPKSPSPGGLAAGVVEPMGVPKRVPATLGSLGLPKRPPVGPGVEPAVEGWAAPNNPPEEGGADAAAGVPNMPPAEDVEEKLGPPEPYAPPCWGFGA